MGSIGPSKPDYDALVIGAGLSGCYACYRMQKLNLKVKVLEAGSSVGGTWYWIQYCHSFISGLFNAGQIDTQVLGLIVNHIPTGFSGHRKSWTNGNGQNISHHRRRLNAIFDSSAINMICGEICSSIHALPWLTGIRTTVIGE